VRDIWRSASGRGNSLFKKAEMAIGNLIVMRRRYTVAGKLVDVPGHIGIVTATGESLQFIHASPSHGVVEEKPLGVTTSIMGVIAVRL